MIGIMKGVSRMSEEVERIMSKNLIIVEVGGVERVKRGMIERLKRGVDEKS